MFYDFGLGGVGQYNIPGLAPAPAPAPRELSPFPLPPSLARPPSPMRVINPYEAEQIRLLNEQQKLTEQYRSAVPPQATYQSPMNPLGAALFAFGANALANAGQSGLGAIGMGGQAGLSTYLAQKNADQEGKNKVDQANYTNQMNQLKTVMGGLGELSKGYGELSKDQAERAKAAALVGADVYGNQIKQDYYSAQNAMEAARVPYLNDLAEAQAGMYRFNSDSENPSNKTAQLALKNQLARDKFAGEFSQQYNAALASAGTMTDRQLELEARRLYQISPEAKATASSLDPKETSEYLLGSIRTALQLARDEARGVVPTDPQAKKNISTGRNPVPRGLTKIPGSDPIFSVK